MAKDEQSIKVSAAGNRKKVSVLNISYAFGQSVGGF